jgi:predicted acyltransferase
MPTHKNGRIKAIDQFRGFAIICMVVFNYGMDIQTLPSWLKHSQDIGMTFADLGTPVFLFAIGLTFGLSFRRRVEKNGLPSTIGHFIRRYLAILGLGAILTAGQTALGHHLNLTDWGVLQAIGFAGLVTLLVIALPTWIRLGVGLGLLALYQLILNHFWLDIVLNSQHGGLPGSLSWSAFLIIATVFGDLFHDKSKRKYFPWASAFTLLVGFALTALVPVSKNRVSASYDLITMGFDGIIFSIFYLANFQLKFFSAWGKNPLLLYSLSLLLTGLFVLPGIPVWHAQAPLWLVGVQALILVLILSGLALYWDKKGFIFSM